MQLFFVNIRSKVLVIFASLALTRLKYHIGAHDFHVKESKHNIIQIATKKNRSECDAECKKRSNIRKNT